MSVYKVPQDVEAEDKLVGPFSFKQMVFLLIAGFLGFIMFLLWNLTPFLIIIPLPFFLGFLFFGIYRRKDQPVETYVAAIIRFYFKPRKRIWDKDGLLENVIITAPKQITKQLTDGLSNTEVRNRLKNLGQLMDTRGWSTKNAELQDGVMAMSLNQSDRLVAPTATMEPTEVHEADDILGDTTSFSAQKFASSTATMQQQARQAAVARMQQVASQPQTSQVPAQTTAPTQTSQPEPVPHYQPAPTMKQNVVNPPAQAQPKPVENTQSSSVMTTDVSPDIIELSRNNDRTIASIAKEADQILESGDTISLHGH